MVARRGPEARLQLRHEDWCRGRRYGSSGFYGARAPYAPRLRPLHGQRRSQAAAATRRGVHQTTFVLHCHQLQLLPLPLTELSPQDRVGANSIQIGIA